MAIAEFTKTFPVTCTIYTSLPQRSVKKPDIVISQNNNPQIFTQSCAGLNEIRATPLSLTAAASALLGQV